jgi:flagellar hook-associated protein 1 FlgK
MSLNSILSTATTALSANQSALRVVSNNVANVNTPGYVRVEAQTQQLVSGNVGQGVELSIARKAADRFLQLASMQGRANAAQAEAAAGLLDRAQGIFGDPTGASSLFAQMDAVFSSASAAALDPMATASRRALLTDIQALLARLSEASGDVQVLRNEASSQAGETVARINTLLSEIAALNGEVARSRMAGDSTGPEGQQAQLIDELSTLMDLRVIPRPEGGVEVRTLDGMLLAQGGRSATLLYPSRDSIDAGTVFEPITVTFPGAGQPGLIEGSLNTGKLRGLLDARDGTLAELGLQLGELAAGFAEALNAAHNNSAASPPPATLTGRMTGLLGGDAHNFTGRTTLALVSTASATRGQLVNRFDIDFSAGTINGAAAFPPGGTVNDVVGALNTALGAAGTATFGPDGRLTLSATGPNVGVALRDDPNQPSARAGRGFSHFFGLNDLVVAGRPASYATGLEAADAHGVAAGAELRLRLVSRAGEVLVDRTIVMTGGGTIGGFVADLSDPVSGLGGYASFSLDADGRIKLQPGPGQDGLRLQVVHDETQRGATGLSLAQMFGLGDGPRADRAQTLSIRSDILQNPGNLAFARVNLQATAPGQMAVAAGDSSGAQAIQSAAQARISFDATGATPATQASLGDYASRIAGDIGQQAGAAQRRLESAQALSTEADRRRAAVEGVNLDEELVKMTIFQQSYSAAARLIRVADEMYDALLSMV